MSGSRPSEASAFVMPGQVWFGAAPSQICTLLGSCVAITLWHPARRLGGMCHYMLPERGRGEAAGGALDGRFGDEALALLLKASAEAGCPADECEAKVFGGGRMFGSKDAASDLAPAVPARNIEQARELARRHRLNVRASHLGGDGHRHLRLDLQTGDVWMRFTSIAMAEAVPG